MHALCLNTRFREQAFESDARLLVYDQLNLTGTVIGDDVRDLLDRRPSTAHIFVTAPYVSPEELEKAVLDGAAVRRSSAGGKGTATQFWALDLRVVEGAAQVMVRPFMISGDAIAAGAWQPVQPQLVEGWLFDLFDQHGGLVNAPLGVHFAKGSGKHSTKFLRASSALLTTAACGIVALVALSKVRLLQPRRVFVDTAPLLSVSFAMQRVASIRGMWNEMPPAKSFSSYGGLEGLPRLGAGDLLLVSASTSGGMAERLTSKGALDNLLLTLFLLKSSPQTTTKGEVLCDLTHLPGRTFGYPFIDSAAPGACALCDRGYVLAELEGDQFLIERRAVKRLRLATTAQSDQARALMEAVSRQKALSVRLHARDTRRTDIDFGLPALLGTSGHLQDAFLRLLNRFVPAPLDFVVTAGVDPATAQAYCESAGLTGLSQGATFVSSEQVTQLPIGDGKKNALVLIGCLADHSLIRNINAQLRPRTNGGCVAYLSAVTIADSPRNLADLRIFLSYGEQGADTFTYKSALDLMLPYVGEEPSPWALELQLLQRMAAEAALPTEFATRLQWLRSSGDAVDGLFLGGKAGQLGIQPDFVFLDTTENAAAVSQADVYAVASNVLACARADDQVITADVKRGMPTPVWRQTVFFQTVLCPSNFRDFNDPILRAALLRAASRQELNYALDDGASEEMLQVVMADVSSWGEDRGDSLPEFLLALASKRMRLSRSHAANLKVRLTEAEIPPYLKRLGLEIPD
jgi:hypothetical protein